MSTVAAPTAVAPRAQKKPVTVEPAASHIGWIEIVLGAGIVLLRDWASPGAAGARCPHRATRANGSFPLSCCCSWPADAQP